MTPKPIAPLMKFVNSPIIRTLSIYGASAGIAQLLLMLYGVLTPRFLEPEQYGLFAGNFALAGVTIFFVNWGMDTWMLHAAGNHSSPQKLAGNVLSIKLVFGVVWAFLIVLIGSRLFPQLYPRDLLILCAMDVLADACLVTVISGLNISNLTGRASAALLLSRSSRLLSMLFLYAVGIVGVHSFALIRIIASILSLLLGLLILRPIWPKSIRTSIRETLPQSIQYGFPEMLGVLYMQIDVSLLGWMTGSKSVGWYSPSVSLINGLFAIYNAFFYIFVPRVSNIRRGPRPKRNRLILLMGAVFSLSGIALMFGLVLFIKPVVNLLLGSAYNMTSELVIVLSPLLLFKAISFFCATILVGMGDQAKRIFPQFLSLLTNIVLNIWWIPKLGVVAPAFVYVVSEFVLMMGYLVMVYQSSRQWVEEKI